MQTIDNVNDLLGDDLKLTVQPGSKLRIAASCFSIFAYEALKEELDQVESVAFIFTSPTFVYGKTTDKLPKERREFFIPKLERERSLYGTEFEIQLRHQLTQRAIARECAEWICSKVTFRSNSTKSSMQQMACIESAGSEPVVYFPLQGVTAVDLGYQQGNSLSNIVNKFSGAPMTDGYIRLFDQIWEDREKLEEVTDQVCDHIAGVYAENSPERIYFVMLYNIFTEFLEDITEDVMPNDRTGYQESVVWNKLFNFQRDAAIGIINKLETFNGCILADSVGLGKTFTALAVVKYYELRNKSVLVLCPKKLADNWLTYNRNLKTNLLAADRLNYDVLNHTDLQRRSGYSHGTPLNLVNWGNYDLVVIDESHNFRNNNPGEEERQSRYELLMNQVIRAGVKTKVLMLSATPVNNRFSDLRNQLALAYEGESENLSAKLKSRNTIEEIFRQAQAAFTRWSNLPAEERTPEAILKTLDFEFFELLDSVTIARSRKHIEAYYDTADIGTFPERRLPISFHPPLTDREDVDGFDEIYNQLTQLDLAVYTPAEYILPSRRSRYQETYKDDLEGISRNVSLEGQQKGIRALMTVNLLKRLESSVHAFRITLGKLEANHRRMLHRIAEFESGKRSSGSVASMEADDFDPEDDDLPDADEMTLGGRNEIGFEDLDLPSWKRAMENDSALIVTLIAEMEKVTPEHDAKLQHLIGHISQKVKDPINPGNRKILLFTAFADTADYLYECIAKNHLKEFGLHTGKITGTDAPKTTLGRGYDFQDVMTLFSPISKEKALVMPEEKGEIDLVIGTDCISEGQNLQDCDYLINYDIHWNPVRIIQRYGRVDRIGSPNAFIQLVNYWPDISLDEYINLKERVENRMVIADAVATGSDNVLNPKANEISYRKEQLRRLQEEVIEMEDLKIGISIADLGLNDFRMDLVSYVKEHGDPCRTPNGLHAIVPAIPELGLVPGVLFTLRNRENGVNIDLQNRLHPYYLVFIGDDGQVITRHTEVKRLLDLARTACKGRDEPYIELCRRFNEATKDGRNMKHYSGLLDQAIRSMIAVKEEGDIESLFTPGKTTALVDSISGLDDFELISFLVVMPVAATSSSPRSDLVELSDKQILRLKHRGVKVTSELIYKLMEKNEDREDR
ncbi:superfamily II DNA or RNA helicase [Haloferula luteola]|uniref:Superfamily II DNA or RNA helicase n=1 Tax=Haloferula luteola TaxID=595692 RepID=A0A840VEA3_9BACT|nr:helicase-related protein [Haloferula luteola]MBB5353834.1 superfamily II DNA or RNA helicase [Haloferula luteola]